MFRESLIDLLLEYVTRRREYIEKAWTYLVKIRDTCRRLDPDCRVVVFGSFVKGTMRSDSDIDVLVITELAGDPLLRGKIFREVVNEVGIDNPFELHIITGREYEEVYRKLIDVYQEVVSDHKSH